jgi:hypothetical protein
MLLALAASFSEGYLFHNPGCCLSHTTGLVEEIPFANISSMLNPTVFPNAEQLAVNTSMGNLVVLSGEHHALSRDMFQTPI